MVELLLIEHIQVYFLIINIVANHALSIILLFKYFKSKVNELLFIALALLSTAIFNYYTFIFSYVSILVTSNPINTIYVLIFFPFSFLWLIFWTLAYTKLVQRNNRKIIIILISLFVLIFEAHYLIVFLMDPQSIGVFVRGIYMDWSEFVSFYLFISMIILLITTVDFTIKAISMGNKVIILKAKFILAAIAFTFIAVLFESIFTLQGPLFIIPRTLHIGSGILMYIGFVLPKSIRKWLIP
ncbi:MAG: hypothetical protein GF317_09040 [Candidatus Lokiarchaeota archaeon]|nr:hypothetical protein [Candidatus Lokiarchaeota archaeon]MBD3199857.1 hypothetical protein [Candidatus Lokiarchaeota archaeon]